MKNGNDTTGTLQACGVRGSCTTCGADFAGFGHNTSCYAMRAGSHGIAVDCGTGLGAAKDILDGCTRIDVLFTHFHYDHVMGLFGAKWLLSGAQDVHMWGCTPDGGISAALSGMAKPPYWPTPLELENCRLHDLKPGDQMTLADGIGVRTMAADHPNGGLLYRVDAAGKSVVFAFDREHGGTDSALAAFAADCDLLIYDGMFTPEEYERAVGWGHSTCEKGLDCMETCGAQALLVTHHAPGHTDAALKRMEARAQLRSPRCTFAREGDCYVF